MRAISQIGISGRILMVIIAIIMMSSMFGVMIGNTSADRGGADIYGYEWIDNNPPAPTVSYNWIEIFATGTNSSLSGDDQFAGPISIGFTFDFYGTDYTDLYFNTNGLITLVSGSSWYSNSPIPTSNTPNNFIAPFWDDLCVNYGGYNTGSVFYETIGLPPNRQFVVEWYQISKLGNFDPLTFEAVLNETGEIWFQYQTLSGMTGDSATIGLENPSGTDGCQYSYDTPSLSDNLAIEFSLAALGFGPSQMQLSLPGTEVSYNLTVRNNQAFADSFDLTSTSVLGWPVNFYDSTGLALLIDTNGDPNGYPDTGIILPGDYLYIIVNVSIPLSPSGNPDIATLTATSFNNNAINRNVTLTTDLIPAVFESPHSDYGLDTDTDGLYNYLVVDVVVNITTAGDYIIDASLQDIFFNWIDSDTNWTFLSAGIQSVELRFDGMQIYNNGVDGPYTVNLNLFDNSWNWFDSDTHTTSAYNWIDFQIPPSFEPPHSDYGLDTDTDGLYNYLVVDVVVNITTAGDYVFEAYLYDSFWNWIDYDSSYNSFLNAGIQTVEIRFSGTSINSNGVDGPYNVELYLYDDSWNFLDSNAHITAAYSWANFTDITDPIADAGPNQVVDEDTNVTFDGSGSTDNVGIDNYTWTFVDGTLQTLYGMNPIYNFSNPDIYNVTLTVRDAVGNSDTDNVSITVNDVTPPIADAGPDRYADRNSTFTFDGSGSTDNTGIINYTWTFFDGASKTLYGVNPPYTFRNLSQYNVTLTVRDTVGLTDSNITTITVIIDTTPPNANAGPDQTVDEDTVVTFDGSGSTDNVGIVNYIWTFNDGGPQTLYGVSPTYTFATPGEYTIRLRATDAAGNSDTETVTIQVADITSPVANMGENQTIQEGDTVTFDASNSTDNIGIVNYSWTFSVSNETVTLYGVNATYKFQEAGEYEVTLTVRDAAGLTDTDTITITVEEEESAWTAFVDYWWVMAIIIIALAALILIFTLMKREKGKKKQPVLVERQPPRQGEEMIPPPNE